MPGSSWLLMLHVAVGATALVAALLAFTAKTWNAAHKWHIWSGFMFFAAMTLVFVTAIPLALLSSNIFLLFVGVFSFYLAWSGFQNARRRELNVGTPDRIGAGLMISVAAVMIGYGIWILIGGDQLGVVLAAFGVIGGSLGRGDLHPRADHKDRISRHLTRMLAATIATITAFLVTNLDAEPRFVVWLAPTIIITPVIYWWNRRIEEGFKPRGMPSSKT